jgi:hypothetical protein
MLRQVNRKKHLAFIFIELEGICCKLGVKDIPCFTVIAATQIFQPYQRTLKIHCQLEHTKYPFFTLNFQKSPCFKLLVFKPIDTGVHARTGPKGE